MTTAELRTLCAQAAPRFRAAKPECRGVSVILKDQLGFHVMIAAGTDPNGKKVFVQEAISDITKLTTADQLIDSMIQDFGEL
jgi:hypothetical protein